MDIASSELVKKMLIELRKELPTVFSRKVIPKYIGGSISCGTLANLASKGCGPPCICGGRNVIYEKESFLDWFELYLQGGIKAVESVYGRE